MAVNDVHRRPLLLRPVAAAAAAAPVDAPPLGHRARPLVVVRVARPHEVDTVAEENVLEFVQKRLPELHVAPRLQQRRDDR